ncbi:MAG: flagellar biosynthesis anti-sigma factor FlgM [Thermodesulfovibrionales bacterium]|nr:flagellar biosynthesis anti-sigma factor FlgM [Thermodesulfovibrionales bacterium]
MKIHGERPLNSQVSGQELKKISEQQTINIQKKEVSQSLRNDRVDISERAKEAARLMEELKSLPEIRQQKIDELREAIKSGKYMVDSIKLAEKILREL